MEFTPLNKLYGQGELLRRRAELPAWLPLPFAVQHGWFGGVRQPDAAAELVSGLTTIWAWTDESANDFRRGRIDVIVGGAPFLYALIERPPDPGLSKRGTIVFPPHGTHDISIEGDYERYLDALEQLPGDFQPLVFCLHPWSLGGPFERLLRARCHEVTSNGPPHAPEYLFRFIRNASPCRYATANDLTTALMYSAYMGLSAFTLGPAFRYLNLSSPYLPLGPIEGRSRKLDGLAKHFSLETVDGSQRDLAATELGSVLSGEEIRAHVWRHYRRLRPHRIALSTGRRLARRLKTLRRG